MTITQKPRICELNDDFRQSLSGGQAVLTSGMIAMGEKFCASALATVRAFDEFTSDNDPYGEHDFGSFLQGDDRIIWKIDYYDRSLRYGSRNPADPAQTARVLTIMLGHEY